MEQESLSTGDVIFWRKKKSKLLYKLGWIDERIHAGGLSPHVRILNENGVDAYYACVDDIIFVKINSFNDLREHCSVPALTL